MGHALVDLYTKEELESMLKQSSCLNDLMHRIGYKCVNGNAGKIVKKRLDLLGIDYSKFKLVSQNREKRTFENSFCKNSTASQNYIKKRFRELYTEEYKCAICGLPAEWEGKPLTLTLDHINGDHNDNRLENLRWVCPNCDRQLDTFAGKNTKSYVDEFKSSLKREFNQAYCIDCGKPVSYGALRCVQCQSIKNRKIDKRPSRETLKDLIRSQAFTVIGNNYGVSDNTIRKWCESYNLPSLKKEIQKFSQEEWDKI
jgi:hypothetical protein